MTWDWIEYSGNDDTPSLPLLLSERSRQLLLAVIKSMQNEYAWHGDFDDIEAALADTITELIVEVEAGDGMPVGSIIAWYADYIPDGWLLCDGSEYDMELYPDLANVLYVGVLPNFSDRFLLGSGAIGGIGDFGGEEEHTLTVAEMPAHTHFQQGRTGSGSSLQSTSTGSSNTSFAPNITQTTSSGDDEPHNNMPPYRAVHWIIKAL